MAHRTLLEIAIKKPEMIRPQYYLRKEDERLAVDIRKERERRALGAIPESNSADGLSLALRVLSAPARAGGSITVEFIFTNNSLVDILLCDSSEECYFLRAQHPTDASVHIGPAGADSLDIEKTLDLGPLIAEHDFITLVPGQSFSKRMSVSARSVPPLASPGRVRVAGIYRYTHDSQAGLALQGNPWEGALVSPAVDAELLPPPPPVRRSPVMP